MRPRVKFSTAVKFQSCQFFLRLWQNADKNLLFDVAVNDFGGKTALLEGFLNLLGKHDGAVLSSGTAEGNRQITFSFTDVMWNQVDKKALDAAEKFSGLRKRADVFLDFGILASVAAQAGHKVWIWEKAHVENEVGIRRDAELISETDDGNEHGTRVGILEALGDKVTKFVDVELRRVDHQVGELADGRHERPLMAQTFANGKSLAERMRAAGLAVAAEERIVGGIDEDQGDGMIFTKMFQERREFFELHAFASIDEQSGARKVAFAGGV